MTTIKTPSGIQIEVEVKEYCGNAVAYGSIPAKGIKRESLSRPDPLRKSIPQAPAATHQARLGRNMIALTADQAEILAAAFAEFEAACPAIQAAALRSKRQDLALTVAGLLDEQHESGRLAMARAGAEGVYREPRNLTPQIEAARTALAEFDATHPEVIAEEEAEKKAATERAMWR